MSFNFGSSFGGQNNGGSSFSFGANNNNQNQGGGSFGGFGSGNTNNASGNNAFGGGGSSNPFGGGSNQSSFGGFGSSGSTNTGGAFGSSNTGGAFGGGNTSGAFGSNQNSAGGGGNNAFGSSGGGGFGSSSSFGSNPFGGGNQSNTSNAFGGSGNTGGAFGGGNTSGGAFGSTTGGGAFGGSNTSSGPFGSSNTGGNAFGGGGNTGSSSFNFGGGGASSNAFGGGSSSTFGSSNTGSTGFGSTGFGQTNQSNTFGGGNTTNNAFGGGGTGAFGQSNNTMSTGGFNQTSKPNLKYQDTIVKSSSGSDQKYHCMTMMPQYQNSSLEELRWYVYSNGKFTPQSINTGGGGSSFGSGGAFGQSSSGGAFGQSNTSQQNTGFNFGQSNPTSQSGGGFGGSGAFGSNTGQTSSFGSFGSNNQSTGGGGSFNFGSSGGTTGTFGNTGGTGGGAFNFGGTSNKPSGGGTFNFGGSNQQNQPSGFGSSGGGFNFGQSNNQQNQSTGFGTTSTGGGGFNFGGSNTGASSTGGGGFNFGGSNTGTSSSGGGGAFNFGGTSNTTGGGGGALNFGQSNTTNTSGGSGFNFGGGTSNTQNNANKGGFNFGGSSNTGGGGFNFGGSNTGTSSTGGGGFNFGGSKPSGGGGAFNLGGTSNNTSGGGGGGFNFGGNTSNTGGGGGFNFGTTTNTSQPTSSFGSFGGNQNQNLANVPLATVDADPYGDQASGFQNILKQSEAEASKVEKDITPAEKASKKGKKPSRVRSMRPLVHQRLSLFESPEESELQEADSLSQTYNDDSKSLVIDDSSYIPLPPLEEYEIPEEGSQNGQETSNNHIAPQPSSPYTSPSQPTSEELVQKPTPRRGHREQHVVSEDESEDESEKESSPVPSYVPTLTKKGYSTNPSFEIIRKLPSSELTRVKNFQIYNEYGSILWLGETNILGLNLDSLVNIEHRFVEVYPNHEEKPQRGKGLNKTAIITLNNIRPKKDSRKDFAQYLKDLCKKNDSTFVEYNEEDHQWTFQVHHFSRYGLPDDDEDEDEAKREKQKRRREREPEQKKKQPQSMQTPYESSPIRETPGSEEAVQSDEDTYLPVAHRLGLNPDRMHIMRANLFEEASDSEVEETPESPKSDIQFPRVTNFRENFPRYREVTPPTPQPLITSSKRQNLPPKSGQLRYNQKDLHKDLSTPPKSKDAAVFLGRSFRASFGTNGQLIMPQITGNKVKILRVSVDDAEKNNVEYIQKRHRDVIDIMLDNANLSIHSKDKAPKIDYNVQNIRSIASSIISKYQRSTSPFFKRLVSLARLIDALWSESNSESETQRKLSFWLQNEAKDPIHKEVNGDFSRGSHLSKILCHLTGYQIPEAVNLAIQHQDYYLAMLLSRTTSLDAKKSAIRSQIQTWKQQGILPNLDIDRTAIYELLSGDVEETRNHLNRKSISCDWRRNLALFLWYSEKSSTHSEVFESLRLYQKAFENGRASFPHPPYRFGRDKGDKQPVDALFQLVRFYWDRSNSLRDMLVPVNFLSDRLDYLLPWLLFHVIVSVEQKESDPREYRTLSAGIHSSLIFQLESLGLWRYALCVALHFNTHLDTENIRNEYVRNMIVRYIGMGHMDSSEDLEFLERCKIPKQWIEYGRAVWCHYNDEFEEEVHHLLNAEDFNLAHQVSVEHLAPLYILSERYTDLSEILETLETNNRSVPNWECKGKIYLSYCRLMLGSDVNDFQLLDWLNGWDFSNPGKVDYEHAAIAEMCTTLAQQHIRSTTSTKSSYQQVLNSLSNVPEAYLSSIAVQATLAESYRRAPVAGHALH